MKNRQTKIEGRGLQIQTGARTEGWENQIPLFASTLKYNNTPYSDIQFLNICSTLNPWEDMSLNIKT